jgi:hypothetical protein
MLHTHKYFLFGDIWRCLDDCCLSGCHFCRKDWFWVTFDVIFEFLVNDPFSPLNASSSLTKDHSTSQPSLAIIKCAYVTYNRPHPYLPFHSFIINKNTINISQCGTNCWILYCDKHFRRVFKNLFHFQTVASIHNLSIRSLCTRCIWVFVYK